MYVPSKNYENIISEVESQDGGIIVPRLIVNNEKININRTAYYIFNQVDGVRSIKEIAEAYYKQFNPPTNIVAMNDVKNILHSLWRFGVIEWKDNKTPFDAEYEKKVDEYSAQFITSDKVNEFFEKIVGESDLEYCTPYRYKKKLINKEYLEYATVNNMTYHFLIKYKEEVCVALIVSIDAFEVMVHVDYFNVLNAEQYKDIPASVLNKLIIWIQQKVFEINRTYTMKKVTYVNWMLCVKAEDVELQQILEERKYSAKALLENETVEGDVVTYYFQHNA